MGHQQTSAAPVLTTRGMTVCGVPSGTVVLEAQYDYNYRGADGRQVCIREGERFILLKKTNADWWQVRRQSCFYFSHVSEGKIVRKKHGCSIYVLLLPEESLDSRIRLITLCMLTVNKPEEETKTDLPDLHKLLVAQPQADRLFNNCLKMYSFHKKKNTKAFNKAYTHCDFLLKTTIERVKGSLCWKNCVAFSWI